MQQCIVDDRTCSAVDTYEVLSVDVSTVVYEDFGDIIVTMHGGQMERSEFFLETQESNTVVR